jgi:predicted MFS family arabinose efflux permease
MRANTRFSSKKQCNRALTLADYHSRQTTMTTPAAGSGRLPPVLWAFMAGNFVIGTGVMVVPGTLNEISSAMAVSVPKAGQLITVAAIVMGVGAPLLAAVVAGWDRRRLLALSMLWYAILLAACALAPDFTTLMALRALAVIAPAIFTPQAASCVGLLVPPEQRGRAITFAFLGWSVASVIGMPLGAWIGGHYGWRVMPDGVKPPALTWATWKEVLRSRVLMFAVGVTLLSGWGQFTVFSYMAPLFKAMVGATPDGISLLFFWFGLFGLMGNMWVSRRIDALTPPRAVLLSLSCVALSMLLMPLGMNVWLLAAVLVPWGLGTFAGNSSQQARLVSNAPALASATVALNTSAIYSGQALGAASGGVLIAQGQMMNLHALGLVVMLCAIALSVWVERLRR